MDGQGNHSFIWHELMSRDPDASQRFYEYVVGLSVQTLGESPNEYRMLLIDGRSRLTKTGPRPGGEQWPSGRPAGHWVGYFGTDDVDGAVDRARELGGDLLLGALDIPGTGRVAVLRDSDGAAFGLFNPIAPRPSDTGRGGSA